MFNIYSSMYVNPSSYSYHLPCFTLFDIKIIQIWETTKRFKQAIQCLLQGVGIMYLMIVMSIECKLRIANNNGHWIWCYSFFLCHPHLRKIILFSTPISDGITIIMEMMTVWDSGGCQWMMHHHCWGMWGICYGCS